MFDEKDRLIPVNRRLMIEEQKHLENRTEFGVLLPEDFKKHSERYVKVAIVSVAADCREIYLNHVGLDAIVEKSMIEELHIGACTVSMVLENYVIALLRETNES